VVSAQCYAKAAGIKGHWDEELHGLDYLVYAYLQKGENDSAKKQLDYLKTITEVSPVNFKVAYAFAAIPSRYFLENRLWKEAANLKPNPAHFPWQNYPWQEAIIHFTRLMGSAHIGNLNSAKEELKELNRLHDTLLSQEDAYKANQIAIQIKTAEAWMTMKEGKHSQAQKLMQFAADMEDKTEKHPVTPSEVIPAREMLGDMLLQMNQPTDALEAYEKNLQKHPNRFNALYGAAMAAEKSGDVQKATTYFQQLINVVGLTQPKRPEIKAASRFLKASVVQ
jgi:tetratricopeptide (TPR) repeat protein